MLDYTWSGAGASLPRLDVARGAIVFYLSRRGRLFRLGPLKKDNERAGHENKARLHANRRFGA